MSLAVETTAALEVRPLAGALGAEVLGIDLSSPPDAAQAEAIRAAMRDHKVIVFRDQTIDRAAQKELTRVFGPLLRVPFVEPMADDPDVIAVLKEADEANVSNFGGAWHSDFSCLKRPPAISVLHALELPPLGGDTLWCDMAAAHEALSPGYRAMLADLSGNHTGRPYGTKAALKVANPSRSIKMKRNDPAADLDSAHPVVRLDPETGEKSLFINPVYTSHLAGLSREESRPILRFLQEHATRPEFTYRHRWRSGDVVCWDNRRTMHLALNDYDGHRRLLHRTTAAGEVPIAAA